LEYCIFPKQGLTAMSPQDSGNDFNIKIGTIMLHCLYHTLTNNIITNKGEKGRRESIRQSINLDSNKELKVKIFTSIFP
jgi:hypothetical protein